MLLQLYAQPLLPGTNMPFNLLVTLNALRLNLEYTKSQRGVDKGYLQVLSIPSWISLVESSECYSFAMYERRNECYSPSTDPRFHDL